MPGQELKPQKAVLISIQPKWVEKIAVRWKTLELRKSKPNIPVPFKCYIYQTKHKWVFNLLRRLGKDDLAGTLEVGFAKVIGEFICDHILGHCDMANADIAEQQSLVRREKIREYSGGKQVFGWHISDLIIYEKPKQLYDFYKCGAAPIEDLDEELCNHCSATDYGEKKEYHTPSGVYMCEGRWCDDAYQAYLDDEFALTRPPQSWCYVQEV